MTPARIKRLASSLLAFLALPGTVAFLVPLFLAAGNPGLQRFSPPGLVLLLPGVAVLLWCAWIFFASGGGTLAPWDPPHVLVVSGPYRLSRNPMYLAVGLILLGWAVSFATRTLLLYAAGVLIAFHLRVRLYEEPRLMRTHRERWMAYAARTPRWVFRTGRARAAAALAALVLLPIAGLIYEAWQDARTARDFPPPGTLVDIGGRRLHLLCIGEGEPTVIFESSGFGSAVSSVRVRERVSAVARVCSYDRAGMGWSDPGPARVSTADLAQDLAVLQDRAKLRGPFVIVASSIGGLTAEMFARQFPERVAGLVLLDAASSAIIPAAQPWIGRVSAAACVAGFAARFGVIRLIDPFGLAAEGTEDARRGAAVTYGAKPFGALCARGRALRDEPRAFEEAPPLDASLPIVVLSASSDEDTFPGSRWLATREIRLASHRTFAARSTNGSWRLVPDSTHLIASSQPEVVADAVLGLLEQIDGTR